MPGPTTWSDGRPGAQHGPTRTRVLRWLVERAESVTANDVAQALGLHPNTVRFHLDALIAAGSIERLREDRASPGRPRVLYAAVPGEAGDGPTSYRLLASILAGHLSRTSADPGESARAAGEHWGRYLAPRVAPHERVEPEAAVEALAASLIEMGFDCEVDSGEGEPRMLVRHCPFAAEARRNGDVVCGVHLGLTQGFLAGMGAPVEAVDLQPLVEPGLCIGHLRRLDTGERSRV